MTYDRAPNASAYFKLLQGNRRNQPRGKLSKDDGSIRSHGNPSQFNKAFRKGEGIHICRRADDCRRHYGVHRDHPFGTYSHIQLSNLILNTENHRTQDMIRVQDLFPQISFITKKSGHHHRKGGIHIGSIEDLWRNATPTRILLGGD